MRLLKDGICARLILDEGKVNAFGRAELENFARLFAEAAQSFPSEIRLLSIESQKISPRGKKIFCAGANQRERAGWSNHEILSHLEYERRIVHRLRLDPLCVVAFVDGYAIGLGVELCLACDWVLASRNAVFQMPEERLGIIPGAGGYTWAHHLSPFSDGRAVEFMHSCSEADAAKAQWLGIVDVCCDDEDFGVYRMHLCDAISKMPVWEQIARKRHRWENVPFERYFGQEQDCYADALNKTKHTINS